MKKCCHCGTEDQDYDKTGYQDETGYYCFNCKTNIDEIQSLAKQGTKQDYIPKTEICTNKVASLIKGMALFLGFYFFCFAIYRTAETNGYSDSNSFLTFFSMFLSGFITCLLLYGLGEIIQLLHNINHNTKMR